MQRDVKIGIAIGVLLIALIAVFWWFRHSNRNVPITETGTTASENELPGPVVPVSPPMGVPGEIGPMAGATGAAPMATGVEPAPMGTVVMPAVTVVPPPPPLHPAVASTTYKVQHGDTLSSISEQFYKTPARWRTIYEANKDKIGADPSKLKDGMDLVIPGAGAAVSAGPARGPRGTTAAAAGGKYVVATGDTLTSIAQKSYGSATKADIDRIYQANKATIGPDPDDLKVGMELVIPARN
ncbi:MAG: LysM peptidoglycan-binding domain-containing protein [Candidatus Brocadiia bacterium]